MRATREHLHQQVMLLPPVLPQWFCAHLIPSSSAQLQMFLHACQNLLYMNSAAKQSVQFLHLHVINKVGKDKEIVFLC